MTDPHDYLAALSRQMEEVEGLVLRQHELIQRLGLSGQDTSSAERFLKVLNETLERARERRAASDAGSREP